MASKDPEISSQHSGEIFEDFLENRRKLFLFGHAVLAFLLLTWPWVFAGIVWKHHSQGGARASTHMTNLVLNHPHAVDFFITVLSGIIAAIMTHVFTIAVMCLYLDRQIDEPNRFITRFYQHLKKSPSAFPVAEAWRMMKNREKSVWLLFILTTFSLIFTIVAPGLNAILIPHPFPRTTPLQGTELNFSSTDDNCTAWINAHPIPHDCNWMSFNGFEFTNCLGENQLVDVLESGRNNMQSLVVGNSQIFTFTQLNAMRFLGPIHGVLPIGPNGIPGFNTLQNPPGNTYQTSLGYNYSLDLQGIVGNVNCIYDTSTPIKPFENTTLGLPEYSGSCPTGEPVAGVGTYPIPAYINALGSYACKTDPNKNSYILYLNGGGNYAQAIGNMTCSLSDVQLGAHTVTYSTDGSQFVVSNETTSVSKVTSALVDRSVFAIWNTISEAQGFTSNLLAESVISWRVRSYGKGVPDPTVLYARNDTYLRLFEAMIQGILQYEATYTRLIYSSIASPPPSCQRTVVGQLSYSVVGWQASGTIAAFLIPQTVVNLCSLLLLAYSLLKSDVPQLSNHDQVQEMHGALVPVFTG